MAKLANAERGQGWTHVERVDLDAYNETSGSDDQTITLFTGSDAKLRSASIVCPSNLTCGAATISAKLGDSGDDDKFIAATTISGLGASYGTVASMKAYATAASTDEADYARAVSNPGLAIDTNFDIKAANDFDIVYDGLFYTIAADTSFDTGTTEVITANKWGSAVLSVDSDGSSYVDWLDSYDTEVLALAAANSFMVSDLRSGEVPVGIVTVKTGVDSTWTAGTDALQGGTGGTVSADTNYYNYCYLDSKLLAIETNGQESLQRAANGYDITTSVVLTLSLSTGNWSSNNGEEFYVLLDVADTGSLT